MTTSQITIRQPAPPYTFFAEGCFDKSIGKVIPIYFAGVVVANGKILKVGLTDNGTWAEFVVEIED